MRVVRMLLVVGGILTGSIIAALPTAAIEPAGGAFPATWARTDQPVAESRVARTWMWGPSAFTSALQERYAEGENGSRTVQYFDKTRMEITTEPDVEPDSVWYVTNGLLARELVTGEMQLGNDEFEERQPAQVNVAGDAQDPNAPTYASFAGLLDAEPWSEGATITERISRDGTVTDDPALADQGVTAAYLVPETNHTVASPFWEFMNSDGLIWDGVEYTNGDLFQDPFFATGFPITEAYWADVLVAGDEMQVLIQVFERRVLTYTPGNDPGWQVEAGNVGQHYYMWRYDAEIPDEPPEVEDGEYLNIGPVVMPKWPVDYEGQVVYMFLNQAPHPMTVSLDGPVSESFTLDACEDCPIYTSRSEVTSCRTDIAEETLSLPPGNYRFEISWEGADQPPLAGPHTLLPNAQYGSCFFLIESRG